jgi:hypothetical protein
MTTRPIYIAVPAWGHPYLTIALRQTVPAVLASLAAHGNARATFIVHTDERSAFRAALPNQRIQFCPVVRGSGSTHESNWRAFERAHRDAIERTPPGALLFLLNADLVCSTEMVAVVDMALRGDKKVGLAVGIRTLIDPAEPPPIGVNADDLSAWIWHHRHPIIRELLWGVGRSNVPTMLFFAHPGGGVSMHCFHLAPMFIVKDRVLRFSSTIDDDLIENNYADRELHLFTGREFALAELSPAGKTHGASKLLTVAGVLDFVTKWNMRPSHLRQFRHRFKVIGTSLANHEAADAIIASLHQGDHHHVAHISPGVGQGVSTNVRGSVAANAAGRGKS